MWKIFVPFALLLAHILSGASNANAMNLTGRLGLGATNQIVTGMDALSFKLQRSSSSAFGALVGLDTSSDSSNYALGVKGYNIIYDEPQLNFYSALSGIVFTYQDLKDDTKSGHQIEASLGAEFSFQGLESLGFSFEFGLGLIKYQEIGRASCRE